MVSFFSKYKTPLLFVALIFFITLLDRQNLLEGVANANSTEKDVDNSKNCKQFCGPETPCISSCKKWGCENCGGDTSENNGGDNGMSTRELPTTLVEELERLSKLKNEGSLTEDEFYSLKQKIIAN